MDDVTRSWRPELRADGGVELGVNHSDTTHGRRSFESVPLERYIELWRKGALSFQEDRKPKPDHLPTLYEAEAYLEEGKVEQYCGPKRFSSDKERKAYTQLQAAVLATNGASLLQPMARRKEAAPQPPEHIMAKEAKAPAVDAAVEGEYRKTVQFLRDNNQEPTAEAIAETLHLDIGIVQAFLAANPQVLEGAPTDSEADAEVATEPDTSDEESGSAAPKHRRGLPKAEFRALMDAARKKGPQGSYLTNFPPTDDTARKFAALHKGDQQLLRDSVLKRGWSERRDAHAKRVGISKNAVVAKVQELIANLGVAETRRQKQYLQRVIAAYDRKPERYAPPVTVTEEQPPAAASPAAELNGHPVPPVEPEVHLPAPVKAGNGQHPVPAATADPAAVLMPSEGGAFLIKPPPGTKELTISIKF